MIDGEKYVKVFNGPSGSWCYEKEKTMDRTNTTTVTFRLTHEDVANLKNHLRNVVYNSSSGATIDTGYYDAEYHRDKVDLSESYRVLTDMASQISKNYPNNNNKAHDR